MLVIMGHLWIPEVVRLKVTQPKNQPLSPYVTSESTHRVRLPSTEVVSRIGGPYRTLVRSKLKNYTAIDPTRTQQSLHTRLLVVSRIGGPYRTLVRPKLKNYTEIGLTRIQQSLLGALKLKMKTSRQHPVD